MIITKVIYLFCNNYNREHSLVVEQSAVNRKVVGSIPAVPAIFNFLNFSMKITKLVQVVIKLGDLNWEKFPNANSDFFVTKITEILGCERILTASIGVFCWELPLNSFNEDMEASLKEYLK